MATRAAHHLVHVNRFPGPPRVAWPEARATEPSATFEDVWRRFVVAATTLGPTPGVRERWHRGRDRYAVWVLRIRSDSVLERLSRVATALEGSIEPVPAEHAHVTVFVAGFPTPENAVHEDDVSDAQLERQVRALRQAAFAAPRLEVGSANAFLTCAMLEVHDPDGSLARLRAHLEAEAPEVRFAAYLPHVTVGRFIDDRPPSPIARRLSGLRNLEPLEIRPEAIELVELDSRHDGPVRLTTRIEIPFT